MKRKRRVNDLMVIAGLILLPWILGSSGYFIYTASTVIIMAIAAMGLNILLGVSGQISIGHAGFMAIGAYLSGYVANTYGVPFYLSIPLGGLLAGTIGAFLGIPALRLHGHYLAIATLGFSEAVRQVVEAMEHYTGGYNGMKLAKFSAFGFDLSSDLAEYFIVLTAFVLMVALARNILNSRPGRAFAALRDSETAAQAMGINLPAYKTAAFGVSAFYAGVAGALSGHVVGFISPSQFGLGTSLMLLAAIVVGGLASIEGSFYGALLITVIPLFFTRMEFVSTVITGAALILSVIFLPYGLASLPWVLKDKRARWVRASVKAEGGGPRGLA